MLNGQKLLRKNGEVVAADEALKGGFQLLDLIITELKSRMTCYNSMLLIGWNYSIQTGEQILYRIFFDKKNSPNEKYWIFNRSCDF